VKGPAPGPLRLSLRDRTTESKTNTLAAEPSIEILGPAPERGGRADTQRSRQFPVATAPLSPSGLYRRPPMGAQSPPGGNNGAADHLWRNSAQDSLRSNRTATQSGPGCDGGCAKYPSVQTPHGAGRRRGTTREQESGEGERILVRGNTEGERAAKVRRPSVVVGRRNPGGADGPGRRTFRARTATRAPATSPPGPGHLHQLISRPQVDVGQSVALWVDSVGRCGEVTRHSEAAPGVRRSRCRKTESQIRDSPGPSRTDSVSLFPLGLPLSPVQLRPDARRPHLRAGHRGRG
jgi:hypothetical protein